MRTTIVFTQVICLLLLTSATMGSLPLTAAAGAGYRQYQLAIPPPLLADDDGPWVMPAVLPRSDSYSIPGPGLTLAVGDVDLFFREYAARWGSKQSVLPTFLNGVFNPRLAAVSALVVLAVNPASMAAVHWAKAVLGTTALSLSIKAMTGMARPALEEGPICRGPTLDSDYWASPSGHTAVAAATAGVIAAHWPSYGFPAYALAVAAGMERILQDHHWLSNIVLGLVIGTAAAGSLAPN